MRYGIIGCGEIGTLRADAVARAGGSVAAVSDVNGRRAAQLAQRHAAQVDRDWRTLLSRDGLDAVIVSTPPILHERMCTEALQSGKHVLCEKPLARSPDECRRIVETAAMSGRVLATGFNYRFYPSFHLARQLLDAGRIGELSHIRGYAGYSAKDHGQAWVHDANVVGGGALHDIGIHLIDLTRWYLGGVESVTGHATGSVWRFEDCEDNGFALLRGPGGRVATIHASWTEWGRYQFRIDLIGTRGSITATCFPMRLDVRWADATGGRMRRIRKRFATTQVGEKIRSYRWVVLRSLARELAAFERAVRGERSEIASGEDGLRAIEIAWAAGHRENVALHETRHADTAVKAAAE
jgi:predicted dehydrogenase